MFANFKPFSIRTHPEDPKITISGLQSDTPSSPASLPPLLLLHGFPQTHHIWHRIAPHLTSAYHVILIDIRGYGESSKPTDIQHYAKSRMARDCIAVMDRLDITGPFFVCGHDRGARVAHKLCADFPDRVRKAIFLDICPTLAMYSSTDFRFASLYFHWFLLIQKEPLPETLISGCPREFAEVFLGGADREGLAVFDTRCFERYVSALQDPGTVHAMCQDYRASASLDLDEAREDLENGRRIKCPLRVLWGKKGVIEKCFDALKEWRDVVDEGVPVDGASIDTGHYIPESAPDEVASNILEFFV